MDIWIKRIAAVALAAGMTGTGFADVFPSKPVRLIVPAGAGSPPDIRGRWLAEKLHAGLGQAVVVENKPGAASIIGTMAAVQSRPDGYTMLVCHQGLLVINPHLYPDLPYDPLKDLAPVTRFVGGPMILTVPPDMPVRSVMDLVKLARQKPGELNFGSPGVGTPPHLAAALFAKMARIDTVHVPYKAAPAVQVDLLAGRLSYSFDGAVMQLPQIRAGSLRALAVTGPHRLPSLPDVPTVAEAGVPGYEYMAWMGICMPGGTPREIVQKMNAEISKIIRTPEARDWLASSGGEAVVESPEEFGAYIRKENAHWGAVIREAGIKPD